MRMAAPMATRLNTTVKGPISFKAISVKKKEPPQKRERRTKRSHSFRLIVGFTIPVTLFSFPFGARALPLQKRAFSLNTPPVARQASIRTHNPVAGNE